MNEQIEILRMERELERKKQAFFDKRKKDAEDSKKPEDFTISAPASAPSPSSASFKGQPAAPSSSFKQQKEDFTSNYFIYNITKNKNIKKFTKIQKE